MVVWGKIEAKPDMGIGSAGAGAGSFYPDWENDSGTCLEDGNEPQYMAQDPAMWLLDSIIECCLRFFQVSYLIIHLLFVSIVLHHFHY